MVSMQDVYGAFVGSFGLNVRMLSEVCQVRTIEIAPKPGTLLHVPMAPDATCRVPLDYVIAPPVIVTHSWDGPTVTWARSIMADRYPAFTLVDVGANTGLFTRQMLAGLPACRRAFVYEPHPTNFACLIHNLAPFEQVMAQNFALGAEPGELEFHIDPENAGNYSLNAAAMPLHRTCTSITVPVRAAAAEAWNWIVDELPIFYKSDTQGHDELIAASIDPAVWDRVVGGILELWRIPKPDWSTEPMAALLDRFPQKRFVQDAETPLSTQQIMDYLAGADGASRDVIFWR